jgi:hypothetical protein
MVDVPPWGSPGCGSILDGGASLRRLRRHKRALANRERPNMRLASKIFLTSALVVVVLAVVGVLSLRAVGRLASVNREITTRTVPALRLASSTRDALPTLVRL